MPEKWYWVTLPHTWNDIDGQDGNNDLYRGTAYYAKSVDKIDLPEAERYFLEINGANSSASVYWNGKKLASALLESVGGIVGKKRNSKANDSLIELNTPTCTRAYVEVDFHSNPERAAWMQANVELIGNTIAQTIADFMELDVKEDECKKNLEALVLDNLDEVFEILKRNINTSAKRIYRVQAGAFTALKDAEVLSQRLNDAGFANVIRYE